MLNVARLTQFFRPPTPMADPPITPTVGESYVWSGLAAEFQQKPELAALCRILNTVDQWQDDAKTVKDFFERDLPSARRLHGIATHALNALDPEIVQDAVENVAHLLCVEDNVIAPFELQPARIQAHFRRLAQSAYNEIQNTMERLS